MKELEAVCSREEGTAGAKALRQQGCGGLEECKTSYGWSPAQVSCLLLQQMRLLPGQSSIRVHLTSSTQEASFRRSRLQLWYSLRNDCDYILHAHPESRPLIWGDFVIAANEDLEWKWCRMISEAGLEKVTRLVSSLSHAGHTFLEPSHHPARKPNQAREGRLHMEKIWGLEPKASISTTHGVKDFSWFQAPAFETFTPCTLSKFLTQNLLDYDKYLCTTKFWGLVSMVSRVLFDSSFLSPGIGLGVGLDPTLANAMRKDVYWGNFWRRFPDFERKLSRRCRVFSYLPMKLCGEIMPG